MNLLILIVTTLLLFVGESSLLAQVLDEPATKIAITIESKVSLTSTDTFLYEYTIRSGTLSQQEVRTFAVKLDTSTIAETIITPAGWTNVSNTFGGKGLLRWSATKSARIRPGGATTGFTIVSRNLPDIQDSLTRGFVPMPAVVFVDEITPKPRDFEQDSIHIPTIAPSTVLFGGTIDVAIFRLISLKHQSVTIGWLRGDEFIKKLDKKLDQAKKALVENKPFKARKKLEQFIKALEQQRKEQQKRQHEASEKGREERAEHSKDDKRFINDNAFFLLKVNAEFIISKLPAKERGEDKDDDE